MSWWSVCPRRTLALRFLPLCLLAVLWPAPLRAALRHSDEGIVGETTLSLVTQLPAPGLDLPAALSSDRDIYVIVRAGGGYADYQVLGRLSVPPERLARALEAGLRGSPMDGRDVEYGQADGYSAATNAENEIAPRLWARSVANPLPIGALRRAFREAGFTPHMLIWVPRYTETPGLAPAPRLTANGRWYDGSHLPDSTVTVRTVVTKNTIVLVALFLLWVPFWGLGGLLCGILLARRTAIPVKTRRRLYPKFAIWPTFGAIAVHAPFTMWYLRTPGLRSVADAWFGAARSSSVFAPMMLLGPMLMMLLIPLSSLAERRLFGPQEGDDAPPAVEETPEEKASRKRAIGWSMIPTVIGLALVFGQSWVPRDHPIRPIMFPAAMLIILLGPRLIRSRCFPDQDPFGGGLADEELTERAKRLALGGGADVQAVEVVDSAYGRRNVFAMARLKGRIQVSRRAVEVMTPAELDFILAHEAAHQTGRHIRKMLLATMPLYVLIFAPSLCLLLGDHRLAGSPLLPVLMIGLPTTGLAIAFISTTRGIRRREYESDRRALEVTRDLAAAEGALRKIARYSTMPYAHEVEDFSTHPALSRRLAALEAAAREIGVSPSGSVTSPPM